jgi:hypothetical protein
VHWNAGEYTGSGSLAGLVSVQTKISGVDPDTEQLKK